MPDSGKEVKAAILEVVDNQLRNNTPPETRQTYDRLLEEGFSDQEARELIGAVVNTEMFAIVQTKRPYDEKRFVAALKRLPTLPWNHPEPRLTTK